MIYNGLKEVVPFHKSGTIVPRTSAHFYVTHNDFLKIDHFISYL